MGENIKVRFGIADPGDFRKKILTFKMEGDFFIKAGKFAILEMSDYDKITFLIKELESIIETQKEQLDDYRESNENRND